MNTAEPRTAVTPMRRRSCAPARTTCWIETPRQCTRQSRRAIQYKMRLLNALAVVATASAGSPIEDRFAALEARLADVERENTALKRQLAETQTKTIL